MQTYQKDSRIIANSQSGHHFLYFQSNSANPYNKERRSMRWLTSVRLTTLIPRSHPLPSTRCLTMSMPVPHLPLHRHCLQTTPLSSLTAGPVSHSTWQHRHPHDALWVYSGRPFGMPMCELLSCWRGETLPIDSCFKSHAGVWFLIVPFKLPQFCVNILDCTKVRRKNVNPTGHANRTVRRVIVKVMF